MSNVFPTQDKWRNMSVSATGQGPREKSRSSKSKANPDAPATPLPNAQTSVATTPVANDASADVIMEDSKCLLDGKTASKYATVSFLLLIHIFANHVASSIINYLFFLPFFFSVFLLLYISFS